MKLLPQRTQHKNAQSQREREKPRGAELDERLIVERMLYEGCPNAQPIAPDASVAIVETEYSGREYAIG